MRFVNTVDWRDDPGRRVDNLSGYAELVRWARENGAVSAAAAARLAHEAGRKPAAAHAALQHAVTVREALASVLRAAALKRQPPPADLQRFNAALAESGRHLHITGGERGFHCAWDTNDRLDRVLWPAVRSAADLLTSSELPRLRLCEGEGCGWFFMDNTRNRSRRWCNMAVCGNRAKVRRFYRRHKDS